MFISTFIIVFHLAVIMFQKFVVVGLLPAVFAQISADDYDREQGNKGK